MKSVVVALLAFLTAFFGIALPAAAIDRDAGSADSVQNYGYDGHHHAG